MSAGENFTVCCSRQGGVFSWGEGGSGQLGTGRKTKAMVPGEVLAACPKTGGKFVEVSAGWGHALALTEKGDVWAWGLNTYGQLGLGDCKTRHEPERVTCDAEGGLLDSDGHPVRFAKVKACGNYSLLMTQDGDVYVMGCNSSSQLGLGDAEHRVRPTFVEELRGKKVSLFASSDRQT